ncbi:hypothetical protein D3880_10505 [Pseudomonas cavernae]|uniref:Uncharacterized protein n=1 Tax=Pseudomonas cavernae TaxID=2320867 RepID=A0A385Z9U0_9PSED|nr:hypothetical protein D3880_10505 [Pseudomonas cavernae]
MWGCNVTLAAAGHSVTLLLGVLTAVSVSTYVIDAISRFSAVYQALDILAAFHRWFGYALSPRQRSTSAAALVTGAAQVRLRHT